MILEQKVNTPCHKAKNSFKQLNNRILWYDGTTSLTPAELEKYLQEGNTINEKIFVTSLNEEIQIYNKLNPNAKICEKEAINSINSNDWNIPEKYLTLNLKEFVFTKLINEIETNKFNDKEAQQRIERVKTELQLFSKYEMLNLLKTIIYVIDEFKDNNVVWGTGRGSSCSSYVLYLIGLHDVDSIKYELDINEFFR